MGDAFQTRGTLFRICFRHLTDLLCLGGGGGWGFWDAHVLLHEALNLELPRMESTLGKGGSAARATSGGSTGALHCE